MQRQILRRATAVAVVLLLAAPTATAQVGGKPTLPPPPAVCLDVDVQVDGATVPVAERPDEGLCDVPVTVKWRGDASGGEGVLRLGLGGVARIGDAPSDLEPPDLDMASLPDEDVALQSASVAPRLPSRLALLGALFDLALGKADAHGASGDRVDAEVDPPAPGAPPPREASLEVRVRADWSGDCARASGDVAFSLDGDPVAAPAVRTSWTGLCAALAAPRVSPGSVAAALAGLAADALEALRLGDDPAVPPFDAELAATQAALEVLASSAPRAAATVPAVPFSADATARASDAVGALPRAGAEASASTPVGDARLGVGDEDPSPASVLPGGPVPSAALRATAPLASPSQAPPRTVAAAAPVVAAPPPPGPGKTRADGPVLFTAAAAPASPPVGDTARVAATAAAAAGALLVLLVSLYQRVGRPAALAHPARAALYEACRAAAQGATAGRLAAATGLGRKTAEHHLVYLCRLGLLQTVRPASAPRLFLPLASPLPEREPVADAILAALRARPGRSAAELATAVGASRARVVRRAKDLALDGLVETRLVDGTRRFFPAG